MQETSYFHVFFDKDHLSFYVPRKNIFSRKRNAFFPDEARNIMFHAIFLERTPFQNIWRKYHIFMFFFLKKDHLSFSAQRIRSFFQKGEASTFLMIQERSYSSAIYLEMQFIYHYPHYSWIFLQDWYFSITTAINIRSVA